MHTVEKLIRQYLAQKHIMQLSTASGNQPWICTVWFVADDHANLYWASWPERRHSQEIDSNPKVAAAIVVQDARGQKGVGIQVEGTAQQITELDSIKPIAEKYAEKFGRSKEWVEKFANAQTKHRLYKLTPARFVLFDEEHFPSNIGQEWQPSYTAQG
jgi:uncharacterized protein YhbP (UPF0306 family)